MRCLVVTLGLILAALTPQRAAADTWIAGGLSFSDELGGFRILSVTGTGSTVDPVVVVEEVTEIRPITLVIRGAAPHGPQRRGIPVPEVLAVAVTKVVINRSHRVWIGFDLELREILEQPSPYGDGLSFNQAQFSGRPLGSDSFAAVRQIDEPYDLVRFTEGVVDPGAVAQFHFSITDPTPEREFFLLQEPHVLIAHAPEAPPRRLLADAR